MDVEKVNTLRRTGKVKTDIKGRKQLPDIKIAYV